jgi:hypothetical protein
MKRRGSLAPRKALWLALLLILALPCGAQNQGPQAPTQAPPGPQPGSPTPPLEPNQTSWATPSLSPNAVNISPDAKIWHGQDILRQNEMATDVDKLLKLASELNAEISSSNSASLTPEQLRKVGKIEKLAHSIKEKASPRVQPRPRIIY